MNSEMDKPMYLEDEKQPRDEAFELYKQFLKLNKLEQDIFFDLFIRRQTKSQKLERHSDGMLEGIDEVKNEKKEWFDGQFR